MNTNGRLLGSNSGPNYKSFTAYKKSRAAMYSNFALTVTLRPECYKYTHQEQYYMMSYELCKQLTKAVIFKDVIISFELTKKNNLHMHCMIHGNDEYMIKTMRHQIDILLYTGLESSCIGGYYLKPIDDYHGWLRYINKNPYYVEKYGILSWDTAIEEENSSE